MAKVESKSFTTLTSATVEKELEKNVRPGIRCFWCDGDRFSEVMDGGTGELDYRCSHCNHLVSEGNPREVKETNGD